MKRDFAALFVFEAVFQGTQVRLSQTVKQVILTVVFAVLFPLGFELQFCREFMLGRVGDSSIGQAYICIKVGSVACRDAVVPGEGISQVIELGVRDDLVLIAAAETQSGLQADGGFLVETIIDAGTQVVGLTKALADIVCFEEGQWI